MKIMEVSNSNAMKQFYRDYSSPEPAKYRVDLTREAPALQQKIESLNGKERQHYDHALIATWNNLHPDVRHDILGGTAGGTLGAGLALTALSIKDIGRLIGHPIGFGIGVTVLGVIAGALTPEALDHWKDTQFKLEAETPSIVTATLLKAKLTLECKSNTKPSPPLPLHRNAPG